MLRFSNIVQVGLPFPADRPRGLLVIDVIHLVLLGFGRLHPGADTRRLDMPGAHVAGRPASRAARSREA
jgi:hypothetical protein